MHPELEETYQAQTWVVWWDLALLCKIALAKHLEFSPNIYTNQFKCCDQRYFQIAQTLG